MEGALAPVRDWEGPVSLCRQLIDKKGQNTLKNA